MCVNKIDFHFSKLRYQPDFEHFSDEEFQQIKEHTVLRSYKKGQILFDDGDGLVHALCGAFDGFLIHA